MGFHRSSVDIHLKGDHILCAYCRRPTGEAIYSELDLDQFLGTKNGKFKWSASNFSHSASDVDLQLEGPTHEPILHAQLTDGVSATHEDRVNLADCIKNENGELHFMDCF